MEKFFDSHVCSGLCHSLGLALPTNKGGKMVNPYKKVRAARTHANLILEVLCVSLGRYLIVSLCLHLVRSQNGAKGGAGKNRAPGSGKKTG